MSYAHLLECKQIVNFVFNARFLLRQGNFNQPWCRPVHRRSPAHATISTASGTIVYCKTISPTERSSRFRYPDAESRFNDVRLRHAESTYIPLRHAAPNTSRSQRSSDFLPWNLEGGKRQHQGENGRHETTEVRGVQRTRGEWGFYRGWVAFLATSSFWPVDNRKWRCGRLVQTGERRGGIVNAEARARTALRCAVVHHNVIAVVHHNVIARTKKRVTQRYRVRPDLLATVDSDTNRLVSQHCLFLTLFTWGFVLCMVFSNYCFDLD